MKTQSYQERVDTLGKELTDIWLNAPVGADVFELMAKHSIKKMAAYYRKGCFSMRTFHQSPTELKLLRNNIDETQKEIGLMPDEKEVRNEL